MDFRNKKGVQFPLPLIADKIRRTPCDNVDPVRSSPVSHVGNYLSELSR